MPPKLMLVNKVALTFNGDTWDIEATHPWFLMNNCTKLFQNPSMQKIPLPRTQKPGLELKWKQL